MKKLFILLLPVMIFLGCEKEEKFEETECQRRNIGYLYLDNRENDSYDIWIGSKYLTQIPANSYKETPYKLPAGHSYSIKAVQVSGYIFKPTKKYWNVTINKCDSKDIIID